MLNQTQLKKNAANAFAVANDVINASIENIEKLANLNIEASKNILEESTVAFKHLTTVNNPQEMFTYTKNLATATASRNAAVYRNAYEILAATQTKINKIIQAQASQFNVEGISTWLNKFQSPKFDSAHFSMNSLINSANQTISHVSKLANEAAQINRNNLISATDTVKSVVNTAKTAAAQSVVTAKKAANETLATAKIAAAENLVTAKKATAETVETVIKSAKVAQAQAVEAAQKSADAVVAVTKKSADIVSEATKKVVK
jgi:phasin family protein